MTQIVVDAALQGKLKELIDSVELIDGSGKVLGRFVPRIDLSEWEPITPEVSEEELDRRQNSDKWYTFEEVQEHLRKLGNP